MLEEAKWHWAKGIKLALEAIKTLFLLNGAAAIAMLAFMGNTKIRSGSLVVAMISFAVGWRRHVQLWVVRTWYGAISSQRA